MGKENETKQMCVCVCVCVCVNYFAVYLKLTQHCKSNILQLKKRKKRKPFSLSVLMNVGAGETLLSLALPDRESVSLKEGNRQSVASRQSKLNRRDPHAEL